MEKNIDEQISMEPEFQEMLDLLIEGVQIIDFNWSYVYVNDAFLVYQNTSREEILGHTIMERYPSIEDTQLFKILAQCMTNRKPQKTKIEFEYPNKSKKWFALTIKPVAKGILILSLDITAEKEAEDKLNKANHLYAFTSQINQNIVRVKDEASLFHNACQMAIEFGKFKMAWIGMFDKENSHITLVEQCGITAEEIKLFTNVPYQGNSPQDYVLETGKYYVSNNIEHETENWQGFAAKHDIHSLLVLPIKRAGNIMGTFNLYASGYNFSEKEEIALLVEISADISFALELFENNRKHKETEALVLKNEKRFRALIEKSRDMKTLSSESGEMLYGSPSITRILGYTPEEIPHRLAFDFIHPDDVRDFGQKRKDLLQQPSDSFNMQLRLKHKDGNWIWCETTLTNLLHEPSIHAIVANFRDISEKN